MRLCLLGLLSFFGAIVQAASAQPVIFTVLNTASSHPAIAPGALVSIYGLNFAAETASSPSVPWSSSLSGVSVTVGGVTAPLSDVSPTAARALIPFEVAIPANMVVPLVLASPSGSATYGLRLTRDAPGLFSQVGPGFGLGTVLDTNLNVPDIVVHPGDALTLYATGLGPVDGSGRVIDDVEVWMGERKAQVLSAVLYPDVPGVYQLSVVAPALATDRLYLKSGGWQSNIVEFGIAPGGNTANAKGTIDGLYPSSDPNYPQIPCTGDDYELAAPCASESFSVMLHAGAFSVSFDITPSAGPFDVAAVGEAGGVIIAIDPASGTYTASATTLAPAARRGDFHDSITPLWDYTSCDLTGACQTFPGPSVIPAGRIPPFWLKALGALPPSPDTPAAGPNAVIQTSGAYTGSTFTIDSQNNAALSTFGGVIQVPLGPFLTRFADFKLFVDGRVVAARKLRYVPAARCIPTGPFCWGMNEVR